MKIKKRRISKKIILAAILVVVIIGAGAYGLYSYIHNQKTTQPTSQSSKNKATYNTPTQPQIQAGDTQKQQVLNNDQNTQTKPVSLPVTITAANQNGNVLNVRALIQYVTNTGTCTLTLTNNRSVVTKTSSIQALANTSTCEGFDIPTSQLTTGEWQINVSVASGTLAGNARSSVQIN